MLFYTSADFANVKFFAGLGDFACGIVYKFCHLGASMLPFRYLQELFLCH